MKAVDVLWHEPRAPHATGPTRGDWLLVAAVGAVCVLEGVLRDDLVWPVATCAFTMLLAFSLPWRRVQPFATVMIVLGINAVPQVGTRLLDMAWTPVAASIFILILPYALLRWASGKEAVVGLGFVFLTYALTTGASDVPVREIMAGVLFLLFPAVLGASVRFREAAEMRARDQVRMREREQLARELHDTVAHHVSAIAIQAQAGQALAASQQEAPLQALAIIEKAASDTLTEMRRMVGTMRADSAAQLAPAASIEDIERMAQDQSCPLDVEVKVTGDLEDVSSAIVSTLYRLTQESMTNAVRHAQNAQSLRVRIDGDAQRIQLTIHDDGKTAARTGPAGFGLQGMAERAALLGGTFSAGPAKQGGWIVNATLPRTENVP